MASWWDRRRTPVLRLVETRLTRYSLGLQVTVSRQFTESCPSSKINLPGIRFRRDWILGLTAKILAECQIMDDSHRRLSWEMTLNLSFAGVRQETMFNEMASMSHGKATYTFHFNTVHN